MASMRKFIAMSTLAMTLAATQAQAEEDKSIGRQLDEAMQNALQSLERFIDRMPGYEAPEVTPEGDIIIRKKRPAPDQPPPDQRQT